MTGYKSGDVVLINFVFSDETGTKKRPALVISSNEYNSRRNEAVVVGITSRTTHLYYGDHLLKEWQEAGLLAPSVATAIFQTIKQHMIGQKLGVMPKADMTEMEKKLRKAITIGEC